MSKWTVTDVAARIQHTLVAPDAREKDIRKLCDDCLKFGFAGAMVQPCWVPLAKSVLKNSPVRICTAFGYPMGGDGLFTKLAATRDCIAAGADEIDFMPNWGFLKSGHVKQVREEIAAVVQAAEGRTVKIMLELGMLTEEEGKQATEISIEAGAHYVKNSSGFGIGGKANVDIIKTLKEWVGNRTRIKASGGIRQFDQAVSLLTAGADMLGTSSGVVIVQGIQGEGNY